MTKPRRSHQPRRAPYAPTHHELGDQCVYFLNRLQTHLAHAYVMQGVQELAELETDAVLLRDTAELLRATCVQQQRTAK